MGFIAFHPCPDCRGMGITRGNEGYHLRASAEEWRLCARCHGLGRLKQGKKRKAAPAKRGR